MGGRALTITPDTNVLVRAIVADDPEQTPLAQAALERAAVVALTSVALCALAWVLRSGYKQSSSDIAASIRALIQPGTVRFNRASVEADLAYLDAGGDYADGVIAHAGAELGGATFVTFDRRALDIAKAVGLPAALP